MSIPPIDRAAINDNGDRRYQTKQFLYTHCSSTDAKIFVYEPIKFIRGLAQYLWLATGFDAACHRGLLPVFLHLVCVPEIACIFSTLKCVVNHDACPNCLGLVDIIHADQDVTNICCRVKMARKVRGG